MTEPSPKKRPTLSIQVTQANEEKVSNARPAQRGETQNKPLCPIGWTARDRRDNQIARDTTLTDLKAEFPALFDPRKPQPLAVGAFEVLAQRLCPKHSRSAVRAALKYWTGSLRYHQAVAAKGAVRIHPAAAVSPEPVSDEHRQHALERIDQIKMARAKNKKGKGP